MSYLPILRALVDHQQFDSLKGNARRYLEETADARALPLLALANAHLGERHEALALVEQVGARMAELDLDARVDLAAVYCLMLRVDEAVALLMPALDLQPDHPLALARLAWCRAYLGDLALARQLYQRSVDLAPHRLTVWVALARLGLESRDVAAAETALAEAVVRLEQVRADLPEATATQFRAQVRGLQLEVWLATGRVAEAEQWLDDSRETLPEADWAGLVVGYSILLAGQDRHTQAEEALRAALKHAPDNLELVSQLAELTQLQGHTLQSIQSLRRAIQLAGVQDKPAVALWVRLAAAYQHLDDR